MNRALTDPRSPQPLLQLLALPDHGDARGRLLAIEGGIDIPFDVIFRVACSSRYIESPGACSMTPRW